MAVVISLLRGVNVGGHHRIKMDTLCAIYKSLKLEEPRTYVQSGNVIFRTKEKNLKLLREKIAAAIERKVGFRPEVVLRTPEEFRVAIAKNPFEGRGLDPAKVHISFLADEPLATGAKNLLALKPGPEELHLIGRELYIYFPNGAGQSKLPWSSLDKHLGTPGTARNWNSVTKMVAMAEEMEAAK